MSENNIGEPATCQKCGIRPVDYRGIDKSIEDEIVHINHYCLECGEEEKEVSTSDSLAKLAGGTCHFCGSKATSYDFVSGKELLYCGDCIDLALDFNSPESDK